MVLHLIIKNGDQNEVVAARTVSPTGVITNTS